VREDVERADLHIGSEVSKIGGGPADIEPTVFQGDAASEDANALVLGCRGNPWRHRRAFAEVHRAGGARSRARSISLSALALPRATVPSMHRAARRDRAAQPQVAQAMYDARQAEERAICPLRRSWNLLPRLAAGSVP
jgi:hypothetical protein